MSAIWGIVGRTVQSISDKFGKMSDEMSCFMLDKTETAHSGNAYFACGTQYITPESHFDHSIILDSYTNILFTSDCILYNRAELFDKITEYNPDYFSTNNIEFHTLGDSELVWHAFIVLGYSFINYLRGSFCFAILDVSTDTLHLFADHFCSRYLAYHINEQYIAFSSTYKPILSIMDKPRLNKSIFANAYYSLSPLSFSDSDKTFYDNVYHLYAATHVSIKVKTGEVNIEQYWNPKKTVKKLKHKSDEEYKRLFLDTYKKSASSILRSDKSIGIMLSGGLDSSSVLAMVAPILSERGQKINTYTSVPVSDYKATMNYNVVEDESFFIHEHEKYFENIITHYISTPESCIEYMTQQARNYDFPIKAAVNFPNVVNMMVAAHKDDCTIILSGSNGNATISYGFLSVYIGLCISKMHFFKAYSSAKKYCKLNNYPTRELLHDYLVDVRNYFRLVKNTESVYLSKNVVKEYHLNHKSAKDKHAFGSMFVSTEKQKNNYMFMPLQYIQKSLYNTTFSLLYHVQELDPTLTVDMVELCMSLPDDCFSHDGYDRCLIRDYMKDMMPKWITDNRKGHGVQSSDLCYKINRDWDKIKKETISMLNDPILANYLDPDKIKNLLEVMAENEYNFDWNTAWSVSVIYSLGCFLHNHKDMI